MNKDTRITAGIALLYLLNGLSNIFSSTPGFSPLVFIDSFLLALLSLIMVVLPPFKKHNLYLMIFAACFLLQGLFKTGIIHHLSFEIVIEILFLLACFAFYIYTVWKLRFNMLGLIPAVLFLATIGLRYFQVSALLIASFAIFSGLWQVYLLARPVTGQQLGVLGKRFYLIMILSVFFDGVYQLFLYVNFPQLLP